MISYFCILSSKKQLRLRIMSQQLYLNVFRWKTLSFDTERITTYLLGTISFFFEKGIIFIFTVCKLIE